MRTMDLGVQLDHGRTSKSKRAKTHGDTRGRYSKVILFRSSEKGSLTFPTEQRAVAFKKNLYAWTHRLKTLRAMRNGIEDLF